MSNGLGEMMKKAQAMQAKMQQAQEELANSEVRGESGGGLVAVTMTGRHDVRRVEIDETLMSDDREVLEDLVAAAVNNAVQKVEQESAEKMGNLTSGLNIPGFKLPF